MAAPEDKSIVLLLLDSREELINSKYTLTGTDATSIRSYKASDGQKPSLAVFCKAPLSSSWNEALANEAEILTRATYFQQRKYTLAYERTSPSTDPSSLPGRYALLTSNTPGAGHDEDFEKFYDEEHIELVAKVPGWLRSRRYKLEDYSGANTTESTSAPGKYLAIHEFERQGFVQAPEMGATIKTPWAERILKVVTVEFVKVFEKQGV